MKSMNQAPGCRSSCEGCAFTAGAQANLEPYNSLKAIICALGFLPFYCHHTRDGRDITDRPKTMSRAEMKQQQLVICAGWAAKTKRLRTAGHYVGRIKTLQYVAAYAVEQLDAMLDYKTNDEEGRAQAKINLWTALELLKQRRRKGADPDGPDELVTAEIEEHFRSMDAVAKANGRWQIEKGANNETQVTV